MPMFRRSPDSDPRDPAPSLQRGGRQPRLVLLGALLVLICAGLGAELSRSTARALEFLTVARSVAAGSVIQATDLATVTMTAPKGLAAVPATDLRAVIGHTASAMLPAGSLVIAADLASGPLSPGDTDLVGTSVAPDEMPIGLTAGDQVAIVLTGTADIGEAGTSVGVSAIGSRSGSVAVAPPTLVLARGTVFALSTGDSGTAGSAGSGSGEDVAVTVAVPPAQAAAVATASAAGNVSLVQVPAAPSRHGSGR